MHKESIKRELMNKYFGKRCFYCGVKTQDDHKYHRDNERTLDHIIPKSKGGTNTVKNLVICCYRCNIEKSDYSLEEFKDKFNKKHKFYFEERGITINDMIEYVKDDEYLYYEEYENNDNDYYDRDY